MLSRCDPGVRSRRSQMRDLGSGFAGEVEGCDLGAIRSRSRRVRSRRALGSLAKLKGAIWVRFEVKVERRSRRVRFKVEVAGLWALGSISLWVRSLWPELGWSEGCALSLSLLSLSLSLSLSLRAGAISLSLSSLSVFRKMIFEGKIKTEIILHPNTRSTEKHFRKIYFPCVTKHPHLRKSIFGSDFHPKQTQLK